MCSFSFTLYIQILFLCASHHFQPKNLWYEFILETYHWSLIHNDSLLVLVL